MSTSSEDVELSIEAEPEMEAGPDSAEESEEMMGLDDEQVMPSFTREIVIVRPEDRKTSNVMSLFEMTENVSIRATQISQFDNCMVSIEGLDDPIKMAKRELMMRRSPLILRRHVGDVLNMETKIITSYYEDWQVNEMTFSTAYVV